MMGERTGEIERLPARVAGLDELLEGGFLVGGVYIVQGPPGAGKTILANQIATAYAKRGGNVVYMTLLAESHSRMLQHLARMSFHDAALMPKNLYYVSAFSLLENDGLSGLLSTLRQAVSSRKAGLLVLDGLTSAEDAAVDQKEYKKFINELQVVLTMVGATALLLSNSERTNNFRPDHTMVDGIIELSNELENVHARRYLNVRKMRGVGQTGGRHAFEISNDGITVYPRIETLIDPFVVDDRVEAASARMAFGVPAFDAMLSGGLPACSATMLLGPSGSGKTTLGLQWLASGVKHDQAGLYFGLFERPRAILAKSKRLGLGFGEGVERGLLHQMWQRPVESGIDMICNRLLAEVDRQAPRRLFIDGLDGLATAVDIDDRLRDVFTALADELERRDVTLMYSVESHELMGRHVRAPFRGVSAITHNMLLLRHVEKAGRAHRIVSILKMRDSSYDGSSRELVISDNGIVIGEVIDPSEA